MSAEENITFKDFLVRDGDSWSAGKALTVGCTMVGKDGKEDKILFANNWDEGIPFAKEWRDSLEVKFDFKDVDLGTKPEDIAKKKEEILQHYSVPSQEDMGKAYEKLRDLGKEYNASSYVGWMYDAVMVGMQVSGKENFDKTKEYADKLIDNVIGYQNMMMGEKPTCDNIFDIKTPFRTKMDKFLGREGWDPYDNIKEGHVKYFGDNASLVVKELKEVKKILPKTADEVMDFMERKSFFDEHFNIVSRFKKMEEGKKEFMGHIVQFGIKDNVAQAFDKQLAEHLSNLEKEKRKEELASKKEEIKTRLEDMKKTKETEPLSGVVVADRIAEHNIHKKALFDKDKELGIIGKDEKEKMMTPKEGNELAQKIQKSVLEQKKNRV